jgi:hypothetical protein
MVEGALRLIVRRPPVSGSTPLQRDRESPPDARGWRGGTPRVPVRSCRLTNSYWKTSGGLVIRPDGPGVPAKASLELTVDLGVRREGVILERLGIDRGMFSEGTEDHGSNPS